VRFLGFAAAFSCRTGIGGASATETCIREESWAAGTDCTLFFVVRNLASGMVPAMSLMQAE
jgi:hypothetical protein